jgi:hypothetical protein
VRISIVIFSTLWLGKSAGPAGSQNPHPVGRAQIVVTGRSVEHHANPSQLKKESDHGEWNGYHNSQSFPPKWVCSSHRKNRSRHRGRAMRTFRCSVVARANIEAINSLGVLFSAVLYGSIGFYLGTNIPPMSSGASGRTFSGTGSRPRTNPIALVSAIGTFRAAVAALVSVYMIIFDETPPFTCNIGIGFGWMVGALMQFAAGTAARLGQFRGATG